MRSDLLDSGFQFGAEHLECRLVGPRSSSNDEIGSQCRHGRKDFTSHDLSKTALEAITLDDRAPMLRNDDTDPRTMQKGSEKSNLEVFGSSSLPFTQDFLQIRPPSQTTLAGVGSALRRRRTWWGAGR